MNEFGNDFVFAKDLEFHFVDVIPKEPTAAFFKDIDTMEEVLL